MRSVPLLVLATALGAAPALARGGFPDIRGTWKGDSEAVVAGAANHRAAAPDGDQPSFRTVPLTIVIDRQDGRRFSGRVSSADASEQIVGVLSRTGTLHWVDEDGFLEGHLLGPDTLEACYLQLRRRRASPAAGLQAAEVTPGLSAEGDPMSGRPGTPRAFTPCPPIRRRRTPRPSRALRPRAAPRGRRSRPSWRRRPAQRRGAGRRACGAAGSARRRSAPGPR
jgi:hypothetical protein